MVLEYRDTWAESVSYRIYSLLIDNIINFTNKRFSKTCCKSSVRSCLIELHDIDRLGKKEAILEGMWNRSENTKVRARLPIDGGRCVGRIDGVYLPNIPSSMV